MITTTTETVPGEETGEVVGVARGNVVRARNIGRDITQSLRNVVGGELKSYSGLLGEARDEAITRMEDDAEALGADAVVNVRLETSEIANAGAEVMAYGTAIRFE